MRVSIEFIADQMGTAGARLYFLIQGEFEDREWIGGLIRLTAQELPIPEPKKRSKSKRESQERRRGASKKSS
jgi:hypothetical protein